MMSIGCNDPLPNNMNTLPDMSSELRTNFLGSWSNQGGSVTVTCPGMAPQMGSLNDGDFKLTISSAATANVLTIAFEDPPNCSFAATVSGTTATVEADKECTLMGGTMTIKKDGTFTTSDGVTLNASFSHVLMGGGMTCTQVNTVPFAH
jgi:hypothetical protein